MMNVRLIMTDEQRRRLLSLLGRVPLKGAEAQGFLEIYDLIRRAPAGERPGPAAPISEATPPIIKQGL